MMASTLFAAGAFTGIMKESGMLAAMARAFTDVIPTGMVRNLPVVLGVFSMPLSLVFDRLAEHPAYPWHTWRKRLCWGR